MYIYIYKFTFTYIYSKWNYFVLVNWNFLWILTGSFSGFSPLKQTNIFN